MKMYEIPEVVNEVAERFAKAFNGKLYPIDAGRWAGEFSAGVLVHGTGVGPLDGVMVHVAIMNDGRIIYYEIGNHWHGVHVWQDYDYDFTTGLTTLTNPPEWVFDVTCRDDVGYMLRGLIAIGFDEELVYRGLAVELSAHQRIEWELKRAEEDARHST